MFARAALALALATFAAASPVELAARDSGSECNTGSQYCCQSTESQYSPAGGEILGLLGIIIGSLTGDIGLTCSPIPIISGEQSSCSQSPLCCNSYQEDNLIAIGCIPITL